MKHKDAQFNYGQIEQILNLYGDDEIKRKIDFVKNFLNEILGVDELEDSFIENERINSKTYMWLFLSLIIEYESLKQNPKEEFSKLNY